MIIKPSHFPLYFSLKCQSGNNSQACSAFRHFSLLHSVVLLSRPPVSDHCLVLADKGFLLEAVPALGLWLWHWSTVVGKRQYIVAPRSTQRPALPPSLHSWEVSGFPGRWSMSDICSSLTNFRRPPVLFCCSGFQGWVRGMRIPSRGNYHYTSKLVPCDSVTFF